MDASQYKDYVLFLLFVKYVSDKYAGQPFAPITIPPGASFADMVALKGKPDFDDPNKLGSADEKVERLSNLIAIFENKALDFSKNRADGVDILGDAYEYFMRHFATESGKSKGQFYTPSEVSTIMARIIGIHEAATFADLPFCMNTGTIRFKPREGKLAPSFLFHVLTGDRFKQAIGGHATGSAQLNFGPSHVEKVEVDLPDYSEQTAIATILSDMDTELVELETRLAKARKIKQDMMHELLPAEFVYYYFHSCLRTFHGGCSQF